MQNARENPIAAEAATAAVGSSATALHNNAENLLDIDFDGAAPASSQTHPSSGASGLEGLAGTPRRVHSPDGGGVLTGASNNNIDDLMGVFGNGGQSNGGADIMNGFAGLDVGSNQSPPALQQPGAKKANEDIMSLF